MVFAVQTVMREMKGDVVNAPNDGCSGKSGCLEQRVLSLWAEERVLAKSFAVSGNS